MPYEEGSVQLLRDDQEEYVNVDNTDTLDKYALWGVINTHDTFYGVGGWFDTVNNVYAAYVGDVLPYPVFFEGSKMHCLYGGETGYQIFDVAVEEPVAYGRVFGSNVPVLRTDGTLVKKTQGISAGDYASLNPKVATTLYIIVDGSNITFALGDKTLS